MTYFVILTLHLYSASNYQMHNALLSATALHNRSQTRFSLM